MGGFRKPRSHFGGPYNKDYTIEIYFGVPILGNYLWICVRRSLVQSCMKIMASMEGCRAGFRYRLRAGLGFIRFRL